MLAFRLGGGGGGGGGGERLTIERVHQCVTGDGGRRTTHSYTRQYRSHSLPMNWTFIVGGKTHQLLADDARRRHSPLPDL